MYEIVKKRSLNRENSVLEMVVRAPLVARNCRPGQFIIFCLDEAGERIPLTIADYDRQQGTVTIMFQPVGRSTGRLALLREGDFIRDFAGPFGKPTEMEGLRRAAVVGGGLGCAIAYPIAKGLHEHGVEVDMIAGFRNRDIVLLEEEMRAVSAHLYITTDDGSYGEKGFTTDRLRALLEAGRQYDRVIAIGPPVMMKFVCAVTKPFGVPTVVSLDPIMIDGTGMCGCCRVTVGGETRFACVDGPEFDGQLVDWDELIARNGFYHEEEQQGREHLCRLTGGVRRA